jgi:ribosomal protein S18 acetylase RimI-like enzyme
VTRAFVDEPFVRWAVGGDPVRRRRFMRMAVRRVAGEVLVDDDIATAALVVPPGGIEVGPIEGLRRLPALVASTGTRMPVVLRALLALETAHPPEPHATLLVLAVEPGRQGEGRGGAMLEFLAARGQPIYLETATERGRALYERHGYEVVAEPVLPGFGPGTWAMLRR